MELQRREAEVDPLEGLLAAALRGEVRAARLTGGSGTGKSTLLDGLARKAGHRGALVLSARASPAESRIPLGVVGQLLSAAGADAFQEAYEDVVTGPAAFHAALRGIAADRTVVVLVDDAQYMDEASARCLLHLCGRLVGRGVLLVLSGAGGTPLALPLAELLRHPRCVPVAAAPLDEGGVAALLGATGVLDGDATRRCAPPWHRFTGGNPRLLRALVDDHRACAPVRTARPVAGTAFRRAVLDCLRGAGAQATAASHALAVLDEAATLTLLAQLLGIHERAVVPQLDALAAAGLLDGGRLRHAGVRAAVLEALPGPDTVALHLRAAELLYESGAEPHLVADHLAAAGVSASGRPGPEWAAPLLADAARRELRSGRPREAVRLLRTATGCAGGERRLRAEVRQLLARAEWETGPVAVPRFLGASEGQPAAGAQTAELLLWHGRPAEAADALLQDPEADGQGTPGTPEVAPGRRELERILGHVYPGAAVRPPGSKADGAAPPRGALPVLPRAAPHDGVPEAAERTLQALVYDHAPAPGVAAVLCTVLHAGETDRTIRWAELTEGVRALRSTPARLAAMAAVAAVVRARTGAFADAARHARRALDLLAPEAWGVAVGVPLAAAVTAAAERGEPDEAERYLAVPVPEAMFTSRAGPQYVLARGRHQLAAGRPRAALGDFHACRDLLASWGVHPTGALDWRPWAAEALRSAQKRGEGEGDPAGRLSDAERRVAVLAAQGSTNRAIAARLYVTPSTVEQHLTRIYRKLRVTSRAGLADLGLECHGSG
ncbi:LuxR family transcriptional regulator [Streptomyces sp. NPDC032198]|uniref:helix-turn-helix transcriptional regulator n=1 Tax=Streptomyces sp. NPDC032198 TaxID=3155127 RepID=UPI0033EAD081